MKRECWTIASERDRLGRTINRFSEWMCRSGGRATRDVAGPGNGLIARWVNQRPFYPASSTMSEHPPQPAQESTRPYQAPPALVPGERFPPGTLLADRYRIVSALGRGGMGEVYRADDLSLGQPVALKFLPAHLADDPDRLARFRQEVAIARRVSHPHCCRVYDIGEHHGQTFLTMEYIDGEDLASLLRRVGRLPEEKATQLARQLCLALGAVHDQELLHRDLKPANVMLDGRGKVRLADFGLAAVAQKLSAEEVRAGTPAYQAPEVLRGEEVGVRSDLFSLGLVLYELFTGKRAFSAENREELLKRHDQGPPSKPSSVVPGLSAAVERTILRCLSRNPEDRPRSVYEVLAALPGDDPLRAALAAGETPSPRMVAEAGGEGSLHPVVAGTCLGAVMVGLLLAVLLQPYKLVARVPRPEKPDVLIYKGQELLRDLGHGPLEYSAYGFDHDARYLDWLEKKDSPNRWDVLSNRSPAALYFWYRQSPSPLVPALYSPYAGAIEPGRITWDEPSPFHPGMVAVKLDTKGWLLEYQAVPPEKEPSGQANTPPPVPDWSPLFKAAGLKLLDFEESAVPALTPPVYADRRQTWSGCMPGCPNLLVQIEAAACRGHPVYFRIVWPWTTDDAPDAPTGSSWYTSSPERAFVFIVLLAVAAVLAPLALRQGREDREGAFRLALFVFVVFLAVWVVETRHVLGLEELNLLIMGLACALYWGALCWLGYVAVEPFARRLWPETLISWSRLLGGRFRDPRIGRDLLIGTLTGIGSFVLFGLTRLVPTWAGDKSPVPYWDWWITSTFVGGYWIGNFLANIPYSIREGLFFRLLFLILFRAIFRKAWLAAGLYVVTFTLFYSSSIQMSPLSWLFVGSAVALSVVVLVRFGVLAVITMYFVNLTIEFPITTDLSAWYARDGLLALGTVVLLAGYGFWISLDRRALAEA
jgi:eukaryotic-like serine/threonine-protein kinase